MCKILKFVDWAMELKEAELDGLMAEKSGELFKAVEVVVLVVELLVAAELPGKGLVEYDIDKERALGKDLAQ